MVNFFPVPTQTIYPISTVILLIILLSDGNVKILKFEASKFMFSEHIKKCIFGSILRLQICFFGSKDGGIGHKIFQIF